MLHFRVWQQLPETERCEVRGRLAVVGAVRSFSGSQGRPAPTGVASRRLQGPTRDRAGAAQAEAEAGAGARSSGYRACRAVGSDLCVCVCCELSGAQLSSASPGWRLNHCVLLRCHLEIDRSPCLFYGFGALCQPPPVPAWRRQNSETWCHGLFRPVNDERQAPHALVRGGHTHTVWARAMLWSLGSTRLDQPPACFTIYAYLMSDDS
jgi:hypothetical protein